MVCRGADANFCVSTLAQYSRGSSWSVRDRVLAHADAIYLVGAFLGVFVLVFVDRRARRLVIPGALALIAIAGIALLSSSSLSDKVDSRLNDAGSVYDRRNTNAAAVRAIEAHPLTGVGWVQFISVSGDYVRQDPDYPVTVTDIEVHNVVLSRTAELDSLVASSGCSPCPRAGWPPFGVHLPPVRGRGGSRSSAR